MIVKVQSTNIKQVEWEEATGILTITFHRGGIYRYFEVPQSLIDNFVKADSAGQFHQRYIRNNYRTEKLEDA